MVTLTLPPGPVWYIVICGKVNSNNVYSSISLDLRATFTFVAHLNRTGRLGREAKVVSKHELAETDIRRERLHLTAKNRGCDLS